MFPSGPSYAQPHPDQASPGVVCPVNARGLVVRPEVGFVQNKRVEFPLPPRGVVHLSKVAFGDDKFPAAEAGGVNIRRQ